MMKSRQGKIPARNVHHVAYRCRDAEQTRSFYEGILGMPLVAALVREDGLEECESKSPLMHLFFALDDGSFLAFFDDPNHATEADFNAKHPFDLHIAFEVDDEAAVRERRDTLEKAGVKTILMDHGFVISVYAFDPNGIEIEFTCRTSQYDALLGQLKGSLEADMAAWKRMTDPIKAKRFTAANLAAGKPIPFRMPVLDPA